MSSVLLPNPGEELTGTVAALDASAIGQCWNGTWAVLVNFGTMPADRVHIRMKPELRDDDKLPLTFVIPHGVRHSKSEGTNSETAVHYQFLLSFIWADGLTAINGDGAGLAAYEAAIRLFSKKPTREMGFEVSANGAWLKDCTIDGAQAHNDRPLKQGLNAKFFIVDYFVRLPYREGL